MRLILLIRKRKIFNERTEWMIYSYITGNLGNQMIEYAFARRLMILRNVKDERLVLNFNRAFKVNDERVRYPIEYFNIIDHEESMECAKVPLYIRGIRYLLEKSNAKNRFAIIAKLGFYQYDRGVYYDTIARTKRCICDGNFETIRFLDDVRPMLLKEFQPKFELSPYCKNICDIMEKEKSICISVRVWPEEHINKNRIQLSPEFYLGAFQEVVKKIGTRDDLVVFITSNDINWCKANMQIESENVVWDDENLLIYEKIEIMKKCKYFILSNSTFSFMGAYLSEVPDKQVFLPNIKEHGLFSQKVPEHMKKENWIMLNKYSGKAEWAI